MTLLGLALRDLRARPAQPLLAVLLTALAVALLAALLSFADQFERRMARDAAGIDLVVGAKGSPLQLVLSGVYHLDVAPGNIPLAEAEALRRNRLVAEVIPLALGDNFRGHRIVGAGHEYIALYGGRLAEGALYREPMEAVLGAEAARGTGLRPGDRFHGAHGLGEGGHVHEEDSYEVTGVLAPTGTVLDRLILTPVESVWWMHAGHAEDDEAFEASRREVTVALLRYASPLATALLPRQINSASALQAASPAFEMARLMTLLGAGRDALAALAGLLLLTAGAALATGLTATLAMRRYELAVMRMLGASRATLFASVLIEAAAIGLAGALAGLVLGHAFLAALNAWLASAGQPVVAAWHFAPWELSLLALALMASLLAGLWPAWQAARNDVAAILARG